MFGVPRRVHTEQSNSRHGRLPQVWHRFAYTEGKLIRSTWKATRNTAGSQNAGREFFEDDAFGTILQWLYSMRTGRSRVYEREKAAGAA